MIATTRRKRTNREQNAPKFRWHAKWMEYSQSIPQDRQLTLFNAITRYGLYEIEPTDLTGETARYFAEEIRPELDRQHKRRKEGKPL